MSTPVRPVRQQNALSDFFTGTGLMFRGIGLVLRSPRLLALGLVPGIIALIVVFAALGSLFYLLTVVSAAVTWLADYWS